ncbi:hypothetical protein [Flavobacterium soyangense]|uniref:Uncharacterized protein n=1 Tax=Flavobacterium soyangense TaxID=2023265 RepID=A0A930UA03_9FLAO|nr:hypothetical protein [Flavobacterium soyangense]MBF2707471.1 hypothetical protein [Flavobacterium soyangense]
MKKKLEADLMSIAHRVLQIKNKSDINQLCIETRRLYEKLAILQFVEEHFEGAKPTIGQAEIVEKMKQFFEENHLSDIKPAASLDKIVLENIVEEEINDDEIADDEIEEETEVEFNETEPDEEGEEELTEEEPSELDAIGFQPAFELDEELEEEIQNKPEEVQISFLDLLGGDYKETLFVRADQIEVAPTPIAFDLPIVTDIQEVEEKLLAEIELNPKDIEPKAVSLNEKMAKGLNIDLNDRIAFVKHLFGNSDEDYNRVLNQLITYDNFKEAQNFIEDMVKPDYNNWEGKEEYALRFIEIIEKKFA